APTYDLLGGMDAGRAEIANTLRTDLRCFGYDQSGRGTLGIICRRYRVRDVALDRASARHRCHHQAIGKFDVAQLIRQEQRLKGPSGLTGSGSEAGVCWHGDAPEIPRRAGESV